MGLFSKKSFVGRDLGHHSLKAVQLEKSPGGWRVARVASMPPPPHALPIAVFVWGGPPPHNLRHAITTPRSPCPA